jgi:hypothetical protein
MTTLFLILVNFMIFHFLCDYVWQNKYMLGKIKDFPDFILPLALHSAVSSLGVCIVLFISKLLFFPITIGFIIKWTILNFIIHFIIDRIKANKNLLNRWRPDHKYFWWVLGGDQMLHQIFYVIITISIMESVL